MSKTLIILNPHAGSGRAGRCWKQIEPLLWERLGELIVAVTHHPQELGDHLDTAYQAGVRRIISIGGDGTNHAVINALAQLHHQPGPPEFTYGILPVGTGQDWARSRGIPLKVRQSVDWLSRATPRPVDIGALTFGDGDGGGETRYFLNIASAVWGGEVDAKVAARNTRYPWTFLRATVETILTGKPQNIRVRLDGQDWYEGPVVLAVVANGTTFGHGMKIAPDASVYDGLFDFVLIEALPRLRVLSALSTVYRGTHLQQEGVHFRRASHVYIESDAGDIKLDLDGEYTTGQRLTFEVRPGLLQLLM